MPKHRIVINSREYHVPEMLAYEIQAMVSKHPETEAKGFDFGNETDELADRAVEQFLMDGSNIDMMIAAMDERYIAEFVWKETTFKVKFILYVNRKAGLSYEIEGIEYDYDKDAIPPHLQLSLVQYYQSVDVHELLVECTHAHDERFDSQYQIAREAIRSTVRNIRQGLYDAMSYDLGIQDGAEYPQDYTTALVDHAYDRLFKKMWEVKWNQAA